MWYKFWQRNFFLGKRELAAARKGYKRSNENYDPLHGDKEAKEEKKTQQ